ncbi:hypothetical protein BGE01nite_44320 [Brevifollis gellanilyticus]|uniref:Signal peptidase I n=2 Tax=Brevifollis gellanilyticus TaxID=748831 RepID=A0A512MFL7_9BACT|nr:hypothetical protein BGE01nite_44320 [Brevifollis gellanilyticus]
MQMQQVEAPSPIAMVIGLAFIVILIAALWKVFTKAGEPGWACLVPFYNIIVLLKISGKPLWWIILFIIPFVNFIIAILVSIGLAKSFGKGAGFGIGLALLGFIFYPILAFGDARYQGPQG